MAIPPTLTVTREACTTEEDVPPMDNLCESHCVILSGNTPHISLVKFKPRDRFTKRKIMLVSNFLSKQPHNIFSKNSLFLSHLPGLTVKDIFKFVPQTKCRYCCQIHGTYHRDDFRNSTFGQSLLFFKMGETVFMKYDGYVKLQGLNRSVNYYVVQMFTLIKGVLNLHAQGNAQHHITQASPILPRGKS